MTFTQFCEKFYNGGKRSYMPAYRTKADIANFLLENALNEDHYDLIPDKSAREKWFSAKRPSQPRDTLWERVAKDFNEKQFSDGLYRSITEEAAKLLDVMERFHFALTDEERKDPKKEAKARFCRALTKQFKTIAEKHGTANDIMNQKELPNPQITSLKELGEYYEPYLSSVCKRLSTVKTVIQDEGIPYEDIYVNQDLTNRVWYNDDDSIYSFNTPIITEPGILSLKEYANHLVIQAAGGMGKSMLMRHLMHDGAEKYLSLEKITIFAWLMDYNHRNYDISDFLYDEIKKYFPDYKREAFEKHLRENRFIFLLDGLDEIKSAFRKKFLSKLHAFSCTYSDIQIIMTSRPFSLDTELGDFKELSICPLSEAKAKELANKIPTSSPERKERFITALELHLYRDYHVFAKCPLLLTFMLMTYDYYGRIPNNRARFYDRIYTVLAERHDQSKGLFERTLESGLNPERYREIFAALCANSYLAEMRSFSYSRLRSAFRDILKASPYEEEHIIDPDSCIKDALTGVCMLYREGETFYFVHNSFQEYFTAISFARQDPDYLKIILEKLYLMGERRSGDMTLQFLYEIMPDRINELLIHPYLRSIFQRSMEIQKEKSIDSYWAHLISFDVIICYTVGLSHPQFSFQYNIPPVHEYILSREDTAIDLLYRMPYYKDFVTGYYFETTDQNGEPAEIGYEKGEKDFNPPDEATLHDPDYIDLYIGYVFQHEAPASVIISNPDKYTELIRIIESDGFPLKEAYRVMKNAYDKMQNGTSFNKNYGGMRVIRI